jgi:NAD(P)-dependent dehydrogenase (short-subunit alcohol dehydrogenase family)
MEIAGTTAFVSGANRGLGRVIVETLLAQGVGKVYAAALDTTDPDSVAAAAERAADVRLLLNNAGAAAFAPGLAAPPEDVAREMETNFWGTYAMVRAFAPVLEAGGGGTIVNVLSMAGLAAIPPLAGSSASKAAMHSMTQTVRAELRPRGIAVHGAYPTGIGTEMLAHPSIPHSEPEEVAAGILAGVAAGEDYIFPCGLSSEKGEIFLDDPRALEALHTGGRH